MHVACASIAATQSIHHMVKSSLANLGKLTVTMDVLHTPIHN